VPVLYVISLLISAAVLGVFGQRVFTGLGFVPSLASGVWLTFGIASAYGGLQLFWLALLRLLFPTRSAASYLAEVASHSAVALVVPYLLGFSIPSLPESIDPLESLLFLGAFGAVHCFFKLVSFYAHLQGEPAGVLDGALLAVGSLVAVGLAFWGTTTWYATAEAARPEIAEATNWVVAGDSFTEAHLLPEGAEWTARAPSDFERGSVAIYWTVPPDAGELERLYFTATLSGFSETVYEGRVRLAGGGWFEAQIPEESVPRGITRISVRWTHAEEPNWQRLIGLRPIVYPVERGVASTVAMSGPYWRAARTGDEARPNIVLILIDGLGSLHTAAMGYEREVAPVLDRLAYTGLVYANAEAPSGSVDRALNAIVTGRRMPSPTGVDGETLGDRLREKHYAVHYLIEDAELSSAEPPAWSRGAELVSAPRVEPGDEAYRGSAATLERAQTWIADHRLLPFVLVVRVGALTRFDEFEYPVKFGDEDRLRDVDRFDNALAYLDTRLGAVFKYIRDHETRRNTYIVVTASEAMQFSLGANGNLEDEQDRTVPIIISGPGVPSVRRAESVHLADLGATLAAMASVRPPSGADGRTLLR
jgi:hypothetical protein